MGLLGALGLVLLPKAAAPSGSAAPPGGAAPVDKNLAAFQTARAAVAKLVDALKAHPQAAHLSAAIGQANTKLAAADALAAKTQWKDATTRLGEARALCSAAQKLAQEWADYAARRAAANALLYSQKDPDDPKWFQARQADLVGADNLAGATPPKFAAALKVIKQLDDDIRPAVKDSVALVKQRLKECESADARTREFLKDDIAGARPLVVASEKALADGEFAKAMQISGAALEILGPGHRLIGRRGDFEKQRVATLAAIAKVRGQASVKGHAGALDTMVADADKLAARNSMRIEEGLQTLLDAARRAGELSAVAPVVAACGSERTAADIDLAALDKDPMAAKIVAEREAIRKLLLDAKNLASLADAAPEPTAGWNSALAVLRQARADLALARRLADGFGPAAAAQAAAANPADSKAMQAALVKLRADGKAAAKAPHADAAAAEFKRFEQRAGDADKALAASDAKAAASAMNDAAQALVAARTIQAEHSQFAATLAQVEAGLKKLQSSPRAAVIKARIDAVIVPLAAAKAKDQAHDGPAAIAALRAARDAEATARQADQQRERFDGNAAALGKLIAKTKDAGAKKKLEDAVTAAKKQADAFDFAGAAKALDQVEVGLDKLELQSKLRAKPDEKGIAALAGKMVKKGGAAEVDAMIQGVPDGGDPRLVNAMATGRYGMRFSTGKPLKADGGKTVLKSGDEAKSMKAVCAMFATMPQDVRANPSIKSVHHDDAEGSAGGGYAFDAGTIDMSGRPNEIKQQFGSKLKTKDPKTGAAVNQLPAAVDPKCKPANENPIDFLAFAAAHEVGHGLDDKTSFMQQHQSDPKYGGWVVYGASVGPLAEIVAGRFGLATAEQKRYVLDMLQSKPPSRPVAAAGSADFVALQGFDAWHGVATAHNVYRRQGDCDFLKIGDYVYHEAYARNWVGYLHAARTKGLTGYQFRAPGEWFAELYAGFRSGKLGPDHPAREWLSKL